MEGGGVGRWLLEDGVMGRGGPKHVMCQTGRILMAQLCGERLVHVVAFYVDRETGR